MSTVLAAPFHLGQQIKDFRPITLVTATARPTTYFKEIPLTDDKTPQCLRHGGDWGDDPICGDCTDAWGDPRPYDGRETNAQITIGGVDRQAALRILDDLQTWAYDHAEEVADDLGPMRIHISEPEEG